MKKYTSLRPWSMHKGSGNHFLMISWLACVKSSSAAVVRHRITKYNVWKAAGGEAESFQR